MREHTNEELLDAQDKLRELKTNAQVQGDRTDVANWGSALDVVQEELLKRNL